MFEILAEAPTNLIIGGGAGAGGAALVWWLAKRTLDKMLGHAENLDIHVRPGNGYITNELCQERSENLEEQLRAHNNSITAIHKRVDDAMKSQEVGTAKILAAINQKSADK